MLRAWLVPVVKIVAVAGLSLGVAAFLLLGSESRSPTPASAAAVVIEVGDLWFCDSSFQSGDCEIEIGVGDSVTWDFDSASATHTITECTGSCGSALGNPDSREWHSGNVTSGTFERTFNTAGVFQYQCNIHPVSMRGTITVSGAPPTLPVPPSPIPSETETPVPTDTPVPVPTPAPPGLRGDVNGDGTINAIDAALVLQFGAGLLPALPSIDRGDVNGNGVVDAIDAALILQFSAGLLTTL